MLMRSPLARARRRPPGFILPAKPVLSAVVPTGTNWIHELKHDGYRLLCRKERDRVQLWSRNGRDWTSELVAIVLAHFADVRLPQKGDELREQQASFRQGV